MSVQLSSVDRTAQLQLQKQQLEAQKLLLKTTTPDGAAASEELEKAVDESLEKISKELKSSRPHSPSVDRYESGE